MDERVLNHLEQSGRIDHDAAAAVITEIKASGYSLREALMRQAGISDEEFLASVSAVTGVRQISLYEAEIPGEILHMFRPEMLRSFRIIPFGFDPQDPETVLAAVCDPLNLQGKDAVSLAAGKRVRLFLAPERDILLAIDRFYGSPDTGEAAQQLSSGAEARYSLDDELMQEDVNNSPAAVLIDTLIGQAIRQRASDIHIEAGTGRVRVRFRVDGVLYETAEYSPAVLSAIITRVKIMGGMDISEKRKPQDGRFTTLQDGREYDVRVSSLPTVHGEKCVLRLQQKKALSRDVRDLGMREDEMRVFGQILHRPNGLVLVTGPTGSGKSTTLYTAVSELNTDAVNIVTVEDPVEANVEGVNQVQVNERAGLTFANVLRSVLRQDPDIIMIGEIRDRETAEMAVQASITGHLVVSTLHTNDTASSITRLRDLGVENYLIADAAIGIIAQRLVRRLCPYCRRRRDMYDYERRHLGPDAGRDHYTVYDRAGCVRCSGTGYYDRTGVFEVMPVTPALRAMISGGSSADDIRSRAEKEGMRSMRENAIKLVLEGVTSLQEMQRITAFDAAGGEL